MDNEQTISKLKAMRLPAMAEHFRHQLEMPGVSDLSFEERFAILVDHEHMNRKNNKIKRLLHQAKLRIPAACIEDLNFGSSRNLDRGYVLRLSHGSYIPDSRNILITGSTGTGKTYLSSAFGSDACRNGYSVKYYRTTRLLTELAISKGDGTYSRLLASIKKVRLLILDDFGLTTLNPVSARDLLEVIEDRFGNGSTIICGQLPVSKWHDIFEDSTVADAVLDRLVHNAHRLELQGPSLREGILTDENTKIVTDNQL